MFINITLTFEKLKELTGHDLRACNYENDESDYGYVINGIVYDFETDEIWEAFRIAEQKLINDIVKSSDIISKLKTDFNLTYSGYIDIGIDGSPYVNITFESEE